MPKITFNTLDELTTWFFADLDDFMSGELATTIKLKYMQHIWKDVYAAYKPTAYARRGSHGGLYDYNNVTSQVTYNVTEEVGQAILTVKNETPGNDPIHPYFERPKGTELMEIVETGKGYEVWNNSFPRPATANTIKDIRANHIIKDAFRRRYPVG